MTMTPCANCGHADPHNGPAGDIHDACTHEGCNCGYDSRGNADARSASASHAKTDEWVVVAAEGDTLWICRGGHEQTEECRSERYVRSDAALVAPREPRDAERLVELAAKAAKFNHYEPRYGAAFHARPHDAVFETCTHEDCRLVRESAAPVAPQPIGALSLRALADELDAEGARCDEFHATMGTGYHVAAEKLNAFLASTALVAPGCSKCGETLSYPHHPLGQCANDPPMLERLTLAAPISLHNGEAFVPWSWASVALKQLDKSHAKSAALVAPREPELTRYSILWPNSYFAVPRAPDRSPHGMTEIYLASDVDALVAELQQELRGNEGEITSLRQHVRNYEEHEAACCPEDVGFEEYIAALKKQAEGVLAGLRDQCALLEQSANESLSEGYRIGIRTAVASFRKVLDRELAVTSRKE